MRTILASLFLAVTAMVALSGCIWDTILGKDVEDGTVTVEVSDAPVDDVRRVRLSVAAVELVSADQGTERVEFGGGRTLDNLLDLRGGKTRTLADEAEVPTGSYQRLRLFIDGGQRDSLVEERSGGEFGLFTPGQQPGPAGGGAEYLEVGGEFRVEEEQNTRLVLDVDLRRGLRKNTTEGYYLLIPALRLAEMDNTGGVRGEVDASLIQQDSCTNDPAADRGHAVYVYSGPDAGDIFLDQSGNRLDGTSPVTAVPVKQSADTGVYEYEVHFLPEGTYTLAFTCQAFDDDPAVDDAIQFPVVESADVTAGDFARLNF